MIAGRIDRFTRYLGPPPDFQGRCLSLAIRDHKRSNGDNEMLSAWEPTPAELALLNAGGHVILAIVGEVHPPVALYVRPHTE